MESRLETDPRRSKKTATHRTQQLIAPCCHRTAEPASGGLYSLVSSSSVGPSLETKKNGNKTRNQSHLILSWTVGLPSFSMRIWSIQFPHILHQGCKKAMAGHLEFIGPLPIQTPIERSSAQLTITRSTHRAPLLAAPSMHFQSLPVGQSEATCPS